MLQIKLVLSFDDAVKASREFDDEFVAIETEYGQKTFGVLEGAAYEFNHHSLDRLPACLQAMNAFESKRYDNFLISHIDLDVIMAIAWSGGYLKKTPIAQLITELVAFVDEKGFYFFKKTVLDFDNNLHIKFLKISKLMNMWKITNKTIGKDIHKIILRIRDVIIEPVLDEEKRLFKKEVLDQEKTFLDGNFQHDLCIPFIMITYISESSVTDRYDYKGIEYDCVLQYNIGSSSISLSCRDEKIAEKYFGSNGVIEPLQYFFGEEAGGHKAVGGTGRDRVIQIEMLEAFYKFLKRNYFNI